MTDEEYEAEHTSWKQFLEDITAQARQNIKNAGALILPVDSPYIEMAKKSGIACTIRGAKNE